MAALILAGVCWVVRLQLKSGSIHHSTGVSTPVLQKAEGDDNILSDSSVSDAPVAQPSAGGDAHAAEQDERLRELKKGVALSDIPDTLRFLQSLEDTPTVRERVVALIRQWAESDARSAAKWAAEMPAGGVRPEALTGVAIIWANQDLDGVVQWALQLSEGEEMHGVLRGVAYEAARMEPLVALHIAVTLPVTPDRDRLIQHAALQWASSAPAEVASWANQIEDAALRERVLVNVATVWGERDPASAAQLAVMQIAPGRAQDDAVIGIVQRWAQNDPEAASEWVTSFPEGLLAETAAGNILSLWPEKAP